MNIYVMLKQYSRGMLYCFTALLLGMAGCKKEDAPESANSILGIDFPNLKYFACITSDSITIRMDKNTDIRSLVPVFTLSPRAGIHPSSGTPQDFTFPVVYTVIAQNGSARRYTVQVTPTELSDEKELLSFIFSTPDYKVTESDRELHFEFYDHTDLTRIAPIIEVSPYATVTPASGTYVDLTQPVVYTIRAENGTQTEFKVSATNTLSSETSIINFELEGIEQNIELTDGEVNLYTPYEVDLTSVRPLITLSPQATVSPASGATVDLTTPQTYTVTASDGTTQDYVVTAQKSPWRCLLKNGEAPFMQVDGHQSVVFDDYLWVLGGWRGRNNPWDPAGDYFSSQVFRSRDGIRWEDMGDAPWVGRHGFGCVVYDGKIWVMSGDDHTDIWNTSDGANWTRVLDTVPWGPRYFGTYAVFGGKMWVIGGQSVYDPATMWLTYDDVWSSSDGVNWTREIAHTPMPPRAMILGSAVKNDALYIIGGGTLGGVPRGMEYNDVWSTADGVNWRRMVLEAPFQPIYWHSVGEHQGSLYVVGGFHRGNTHTNEVWYSSDGVQWARQKYPFFEPRHAQSVVTFRGNLYLIGGTVDPPSLKDTRNDVWMMEGGF